MADYQEILNRFREHGQEQVFANWESLSQSERQELLADCASVDFDWIAARWNEFKNAGATTVKPKLEPAEVVRLPRSGQDELLRREAMAIGEEKLRQGKVAAFLVAGGQGTRLGYAGPKGSFPVGPVGNRTLFQWHAEQILARGRRYGAAIPWYIMTSRDNDAATKTFFADHDYFGLKQENIYFFSQEMVPCLDFSGKLMLAGPARLARNPNGHGGSLSGLVRSGAIDDMIGRGIEIISYFQVDNPLVTIADPVYIGWHVKTGSQMSCKVLEKTTPDEPIGVVCLLDGKPAVVEYSDLDEDSMHARDKDGCLLFWAGSIAIHMIDVAFAKQTGAAGRLPWHQARKKVPFFRDGTVVKPGEPNAVKFETFVFDALPNCDKSLNLEVCREHEFAPVKNATGKDSVESSRRLLSDYFLEWLAACGIEPSHADTLVTNQPLVEISPLYSLDQGELANKIRRDGFKLERSLLLD
ncbi:MAG: UDPGP type 1 family protein [Planctomycetes bacterium]|nr:UDPGP type 1 family protein [Planctomycetota bacterium]